MTAVATSQSDPESDAAPHQQRPPTPSGWRRRVRSGLSHRLLQVFLTLFLVSVGTMLMMELTPGDPAYTVLGENAAPEDVARVRETLGLNEPFPQRYVDWVGSAVTGDLGTSLQTQRPVTEEIMDRVPVTVEITVLALLLSVVISVPLAMYTAYRANGSIDRITQFFTSLFISSPQFLSALLLSYFLGLRLGWFPVTGWTPISEGIGANLRGAFLPALTLALGEIAVFTRLLRSDVVATLQENYILAAKAKGLTPRYILFRHALRPSSFSLLTLAAISLGRLLGGSIIVEAVFSLPGIGTLMVHAIGVKDLVVVQGIVIVIAVVYVTANALVDVLHGRLDPRANARST